MTEDQKLKYLSMALRMIGAVFIVGLYPMMMWIWPEGWGHIVIHISVRQMALWLQLIDF